MLLGDMGKQNLGVMPCGRSRARFSTDIKNSTNMPSSRAAAATIVTVPTCWYLLSGSPESAHGHEDHEKDHAKPHKEDDEDEPAEEESKDEDKDSEKSEDSDSDSEDDEEKLDTPDSSDDEGKDDKEDKSDEVDETGNVRKHIPDAKGGAKKRIESAKGIKAGESNDSDDGDKVRSFERSSNFDPY